MNFESENGQELKTKEEEFRNLKNNYQDVISKL